MGRQIEKRVSAYDPNDRSAVSGWVLRRDGKFVWSGWLLLLEIDGMIPGGDGLPAR
jgi:hypothetical protein